MLKEFTATLHPPLLGQLVEKVFAQMQLAGEAGSLLKIEEDIAALVGEAKKLWSSPRKAEQTKFDLGMAEKPRQGEFPLDVSGISDESFWETAEERIYFALKEYAEKADSASYQRRLFADDAARGFAFIDLCRKRYDVVVMNPPFGDSTQQLVAFLEHSFPYANLDLAACFLDNGIRMSVECGIIGAITARSLYFLSSFERFRRNQLLKENSFVFFADLGAGVLDAFIDVALIVVEHKKPDANESICFGLKQVDEKAEALQGKISSLSANTQDISIHRSTFFLSLPSAAFSFWTSQGIALLLHPNNSLASAKVETCVGLQTDDDNRFLRLTWEISPENIGSKGGWCFLAKGGEYSKFWDDIHLMIDWSDDGAAVKQFVASLFGSASKHVQNERNYFRRGLTYPFRTAKGFNVRCMPENCIFTLQGMAIFAPEDDIPHLEFLLGLLNSHVILYLLRMLTSSDAYQVGYVRRLPCQIQNRHMVTNIRCLTRKAVNARRYLDQYDETTRSFFVSFAFSRSANGLNYAAAKAKEEVDSVITIMEESIVAINESVISGFALTREDANSVLASVSEPRQKFSFSEHSSITADFVAYSIGAAFGRWDIRYATGEFQTPELPDPFAPLPSCPPGMLQNAVG
ncbi:MAG TPA: hypothetical protein PK528_15115, partial [Syntrophorhabdus sp.]|nr:hypothetical protein [Syntrophorhabdus sp.]